MQHLMFNSTSVSITLSYYMSIKQNVLLCAKLNLNALDMITVLNFSSFFPNNLIKQIHNIIQTIIKLMHKNKTNQTPK